MSYAQRYSAKRSSVTPPKRSTPGKYAEQKQQHQQYHAQQRPPPTTNNNYNKAPGGSRYEYQPTTMSYEDNRSSQEYQRHPSPSVLQYQTQEPRHDTFNYSSSSSAFPSRKAGGGAQTPISELESITRSLLANTSSPSYGHNNNNANSRNEFQERPSSMMHHTQHHNHNQQQRGAMHPSQTNYGGSGFSHNNNNTSSSSSMDYASRDVRVASRVVEEQRRARSQRRTLSRDARASPPSSRMTGRMMMEEREVEGVSPLVVGAGDRRVLERIRRGIATAPPYSSPSIGTRPHSPSASGMVRTPSQRRPPLTSLSPVDAGGYAQLHLQEQNQHNYHNQNRSAPRHALNNNNNNPYSNHHHHHHHHAPPLPNHYYDAHTNTTSGSRQSIESDRSVLSGLDGISKNPMMSGMVGISHGRSAAPPNTRGTAQPTKEATHKPRAASPLSVASTVSSGTAATMKLVVPLGTEFSTRIRSMIEVREQMESLVRKQKEDERDLVMLVDTLLRDQFESSRRMNEKRTSDDDDDDDNESIRNNNNNNNNNEMGHASDGRMMRAIQQRNRAIEMLNTFRKEGSEVVNRMHEALKKTQGQNIELTKSCELLRVENERLKRTLTLTGNQQNQNQQADSRSNASTSIPRGGAGARQEDQPRTRAWTLNPTDEPNQSFENTNNNNNNNNNETLSEAALEEELRQLLRDVKRRSAQTASATRSVATATNVTDDNGDDLREDDDDYDHRKSGGQRIASPTSNNNNNINFDENQPVQLATITKEELCHYVLYKNRILLRLDELLQEADAVIVHMRAENEELQRRNEDLERKDREMELVEEQCWRELAMSGSNNNSNISIENVRTAWTNDLMKTINSRAGSNASSSSSSFRFHPHFLSLALQTARNDNNRASSNGVQGTAAASSPSSSQRPNFSLMNSAEEKENLLEEYYQSLRQAYTMVIILRRELRREKKQRLEAEELSHKLLLEHQKNVSLLEQRLSSSTNLTHHRLTNSIGMYGTRSTTTTNNNNNNNNSSSVAASPSPSGGAGPQPQSSLATTMSIMTHASNSGSPPQRESSPMDFPTNPTNQVGEGGEGKDGTDHHHEEEQLQTKNLEEEEEESKKMLEAVKKVVRRSEGAEENRTSGFKEEKEEDIRESSSSSSNNERSEKSPEMRYSHLLGEGERASEPKGTRSTSQQQQQKQQQESREASNANQDMNSQPVVPTSSSLSQQQQQPVTNPTRGNPSYDPETNRKHLDEIVRLEAELQQFVTSLAEEEEKV